MLNKLENAKSLTRWLIRNLCCCNTLRHAANIKDIYSIFGHLHSSSARSDEAVGLRFLNNVHKTVDEIVNRKNYRLSSIVVMEKSLNSHGPGSLFWAPRLCWGNARTLYYTWFAKSYRLYPSHDALQVPTLIGVLASVCTPSPTQTQQLPTLFLTRPFARSLI